MNHKYRSIVKIITTRIILCSSSSSSEAGKIDLFPLFSSIAYRGASKNTYVTKVGRWLFFGAYLAIEQLSAIRRLMSYVNVSRSKSQNRLKTPNSWWPLGEKKQEGHRQVLAI